MDIQLILVPYDTARRGWRSGAGPEHLLRAGLVDHLHRQGHAVLEVQLIEDDPTETPAEIRTAFELIRRLAVAVRAARAAGRFPLVLAGNCNSAVGTLSGLSPASRAIFWFDAHGDLNTPDITPSGFLDGMGLAIALGWCWHEIAASTPGFQSVSPEATFLIGARDLDPSEIARLAQDPVSTVSVADTRTRLSQLLAAAPVGEMLGYLHLDLDVLDPGVGRANSLPVPGGLSATELTTAIAAIRHRTRLGAAALTSYAHEYDTEQGVCRAAFAAIDAIVATGT